MAASPSASQVGDRRKSFILALVALAAFAALLALAGCGSSSEPSGSTSPSTGATGAVPQTMRVGYQLIPNGDLIVKDQKWLETALPDTKIDWVKFDSGADVNTAMLAGSIDIALAGSSPVAAGLSKPMSIPYKVLWIHDLIGTAESLVASNSSGVTEIPELAGKKVATPFGSTAHFSLLAALQGSGVDPSQVKIVDLQPQDILAAWQRGDIDAAYVWNPTLAELEKDGKVLVTSAELAKRGAITADLAVVTTAFADKYPGAVQTWVEQESRAVELYKTDSQAATEAVGRQLNISADEAYTQMQGLILLDASEQAGSQYLGTPDAPGDLAEVLQKTAEFLKAQESVQEVPSLADFQAALANQFVAAVGGM
jgi:taurine transport system substrate-binding protein